MSKRIFWLPSALSALSALSAVLAVVAVAALGCATAPPPRLDAKVVEPGQGERVVVDQSLILFDASGSIGEGKLFPSQKALVESFVAGMPQGSYQAGALAFGGEERQSFPLARFDRSRLSGQAAQLRYIGDDTPLDAAIGDAAAQLGGGAGRVALVIFSDGLPMDRSGVPGDPEVTLEAARKLLVARKGDVCIHTVQTGNAPEGRELLSQLAELSSCGSYRNAASVGAVASLYDFERQVFLGRKLPAVAAPAPDSDGDGVYDNADRCPGTPRGAKVDPRGCWTMRGVNFATDSYAIPTRYSDRIDEVAQVMRANPNLRVRVDGHTDARGSEGHNQGLSQNRARAVRDALVAAGIPADRFEVVGWGESRPAAPNDTPDNLYANRRIEFSVIE